MEENYGLKNYEKLDGFSMCQERYVDELLKKHIIDACNQTFTEVQNIADMHPALIYEVVVEQIEYGVIKRRLMSLYIGYINFSN